MVPDLINLQRMKDEEDFTDLKDFRDFAKIFMKRDLKSSDYLISFKIQNK